LLQIGQAALCQSRRAQGLPLRFVLGVQAAWAIASSSFIKAIFCTGLPPSAR